MDCILTSTLLNKFIFIVLAIIAGNNRVNLLLNGSPKSSSSFIENHIVKMTEDGFMNVTLPTFEEKIDYDVGETASWTVLIDYTEYNQPLFNLQWHKNGRPIYNYNNKDADSEKRYEIVDSVDYHTSLTVRNVSKTDEGHFQLFINIADGNHTSFMINFTLRVRDEPSYFIIKTTPSDDDKLGFICWIYSRPPIIGFTFPGWDQSLQSPKKWREMFNLDKESYTVALLSEENAITIFVQPQTGHTSKNLVQTMRSLRRISSPRNIDQIQLSCTTSNITSNINRIPYSSDNLIWSLKLPKNDTSIKLDDFSNPQGLRTMSLPCIFFGLHHQPCPFIQMLVWRNVTKATEGLYSVSVFNENTETKTQALAFKIKASTRPSIWNSSSSNNFAKEGEDASIFCQANGSPLPSMTIWTKDGSLITNTSTTLIKLEKTELMVTSVLVLFSTRTTDSGGYTCSFDNTAGEIKRIINLHITPIQRNITNDTEGKANK